MRENFVHSLCVRITLALHSLFIANFFIVTIKYQIGEVDFMVKQDVIKHPYSSDH